MSKHKRKRFKGAPGFEYGKVHKKDRLTYLRANTKRGMKHFLYDPVSRRAAFEGWKYRNLPPIENENCYVCDKAAEHWHHIIQISRGGWDTNSNIVPVCLSCHKKVHRHDATRQNRRPIYVAAKFVSPLVAPKVMIEFVPAQ